MVPPTRSSTDSTPTEPTQNALSRDTVSTVSRLRTMVGVTGFEPATSSSRTKRATKLRHTPWRSCSPEVARSIGKDNARRAAR